MMKLYHWYLHLIYSWTKKISPKKTLKCLQYIFSANYQNYVLVKILLNDNYNSISSSSSIKHLSCTL